MSEQSFTSVSTSLITSTGCALPTFSPFSSLYVMPRWFTKLTWTRPSLLSGGTASAICNPLSSTSTLSLLASSDCMFVLVSPSICAWTVHRPSFGSSLGDVVGFAVADAWTAG